MLSATVHDVLYYMSPIYCQAIIDSVLQFPNFDSLFVLVCDLVLEFLNNLIAYYTLLLSSSASL